jgi:hypothetical protein
MLLGLRKPNDELGKSRAWLLRKLINRPRQSLLKSA